MFFFFSKVLSPLCHPFSWVLIGLLVTFLLKNERTSKGSFRATILIALIFSNPFLFYQCIKLWEIPSKKLENSPHYDCGIILGGMAYYNEDYERLTLNRESDRLWQAINLYHFGKVDKLLITGSNGNLFSDLLMPIKS